MYTELIAFLIIAEIVVAVITYLMARHLDLTRVGRIALVCLSLIPAGFIVTIMMFYLIRDRVFLGSALPLRGPKLPEADYSLKTPNKDFKPTREKVD